MARRFQRRRTKGWQAPAGAVYVGRGTMWGNPWQAHGLTVIGPAWAEYEGRPMSSQVFTPGASSQVAVAHRVTEEEAVIAAVGQFRDYCTTMRVQQHAEFMEWIAPLRGRDLMCWCAEDVPCHADVLLEHANLELHQVGPAAAGGPVKAPFPYYGGKTRLAEEIVALLPEHTHYVEPFAGALSVLLAKPRSVLETVNDINGDIVNLFKVMRDRTGDLERVCALTPHSREEHTLARDRDVEDDLERARRTFVSLSQGSYASLRRTGWAHFQKPAGAGSRPAYLQQMVGRFAPVAERLLDVSFEHRDGLDVIREYGRHSDNCLYVDPPYLSATKTSAGYASEFGRPDQHAELLDALVDCKAAVVLSGYPSELYDDRLAGWDCLTLGARKANGKAAPETVWSNRPITRQYTLDVEGLAS